MRFAVFLALALPCGAVAASDGPISKFDDHAPIFAGRSSRAIFDIERRLLDIGGKLGAPFVYSQPDRPDQVTLLWIDKARAIRRIDLTRDGAGTIVKAWHPREHAAECAGL